MIDDTVYLYPVRTETVREPVYKHLWQGWLTFGQTEVERVAEGLLGLRNRLFGSWPEPEKLGRSIRPGPRFRNMYATETIWDSDGVDDWSWEETHFCGWKELFHPTRQVTRDVEEVNFPQPSTSTGTLLHGVSMTGVRWDPQQGVQLPGGLYTKVVARTVSGVLLFDVSVDSPQNIGPGDSLILRGFNISISHM